MKEYVKCANPYMPLWEHVPDGEPRVFEYNGEKRVYVYGSHDIERTQYCGRDYVVWSAPVDDLTNWKCHGVCYETQYDSVLYAPDVVQKGDTFYMYAAERKGSLVVVATSKQPWGPFENPVETKIGFDPGVLVDDDGKVYVYWGFCGSICAQLEDDMATIIEDTIHTNPIGHALAPMFREPDEFVDYKDAFFEASSPRKIFGKYVYIYSKRYETEIPKYGIKEDCNGFLSYKWSDKPLEDYRGGGDISYNGGEIITASDGSKISTYQWGNNHGSLMEINGQWYIFYHRQTGTDEYSRQACLEPVDVAMDKQGNIFIGDITYENGEPVSSKPVEMTSQGPNTNGIDAYKWISAGYACHIYGGSSKAYVLPVYEKRDDISAPVTGITTGTRVGFRYIQFGENSPKKATIVLDSNKALSVHIRLDSYDGNIVGKCDFTEESGIMSVDITEAVTGKHAVYFEFISKEEGVVAQFNRFTFD